MRMFKIFTFPMLVFLSLTLSSCSQKLSGGVGGAYAPAVVYNANTGLFLTVYGKYLSGGKNQRRICARFLDSTGSPAGSELVISESGEAYTAPSVAFENFHHKFFVVWTGSNLYGQVINEDGTLYGDRLVVPARLESGASPSVLFDEVRNEFLVAWTESDSVYAQYVTTEGSPVGEKITVSRSAASDASVALIYDRTNERFFCTWESGGHGIKGTIINSDGSVAVPEFLISAANGLQYRSAITMDTTNSRFLITWEESDPNTDTYSLKGQVLDKDGVPFGSVWTISPLLGLDVDYHRSAYDPARQQYFIVFGDANKGQVYGKLIAPDGAPSNSTSLLSHPDYPGDRHPDLAYDSVSDTYLAVWGYELSDQEQKVYSDIHSRLINSDGTPAGDVVIVSNGGAW